MSGIPNIKQNKDKSEMFRFIPFSICVALILILVYILGLAPIKKYELADTDCYLRLIRVEDLHKGGNWYDPVFIRINPPSGQTSHWTRPFDVLLFVGALPISLFTDFRSALFWWGVIISPVLLIAALVALQWSTRPFLILSKDGPFLACLLFVSQLITLDFYQAGRPDHHSLIILVFIISIGLTLRMILKPFSVRLCYLAGAISGLSMWISVESLVPVSITIGVLGLLWLLDDGDLIDKSLYYTLTLFITTFLSLIFERTWSSLLAEEYDRLSIVHFSIFGFITILWTMLFVLNSHTKFLRKRVNRFSSILVAVAMLALAILISFPKFYKGPFVDIDPRIARLWLSKVYEMRPLISRGGPIAIPVQLLGSILLVFSFLLYTLRKNSISVNRKGWIYILLASFVFILVSIYQIRWSVYPQILLTIPMAQLMLILRQKGPNTGFQRILKNMLILILFCAGPPCLGIFAERFMKIGDSAKNYQEVSLIQICDYLTQAEELDGQDLLILTHIDFGAEILYRTQHNIIATPTATGTPHRNGKGILDTYDIMTADTDEKALGIIQKRRVDLILLCPKSTESVLYSKPELASTFYHRLLQDKIPHWLRRLELPPGLSSKFQLFEIIER